MERAYAPMERGIFGSRARAGLHANPGRWARLSQGLGDTIPKCGSTADVSTLIHPALSGSRTPDGHSVRLSGLAGPGVRWGRGVRERRYAMALTTCSC
jgi:hypothetical protein